VGHILVLSVEWAYNTYEMYVEGGGRFDFELEMICLVVCMVNYVFYGKMFGRLGALLFGCG
jgi:hypothetical protein